MKRLWLSPAQQRFVAAARDVGRQAAAPAAAAVDREARWPREAMGALGEAGLLGLCVPQSAGGHGEGLLSLALVTEELAKSCASTSMCYGMHCVAAAVLSAKATPSQAERYLRPIARGAHVTSLALSEPGTGVHFYVPATTFAAASADYVLNGRKSFVTSGGEADSYVVSAVAAGTDQDPGTFSCFILDRDAPGLGWLAPWDGLGMRGNSSRSATLRDVRVPGGNLLGRQGDQIWYVFEVVAPYFIVAMSGTYLGIAARALEIAIDHLQGRVHTHTDSALADSPALVHDLARAWTAVERARQLLYAAARLGDAGAAEASRHLFAAKIEVADVAVRVTNDALNLAGGQGYQSNAELGRLLRDARAGPVMSPSTQLLEWWLGRTILERPIF
jgi:alkylation response protein AidB-like acyl-CoA dehydrogenase